MTSPQIFSVSALNNKIKYLLESNFVSIWLEAEISNLTKAVSGHWYLSLKDADSQVRCAMFKGSNRKVTFTPKNGDQVLVRANVSLYHPRGEYQLIIESMQPAGLGQLQQAFDRLKLKLSNEGLFAAENKKPLPDFIEQVAIVTSAKGAAVHDMVSIMQRLSPNIQINIYPCNVQGNLAKAEIVEQIVAANANQDNDLIIVGRGGGSLEDLWAFNEEIVARAIAASDLPVISAVGHETDTTIADFVADVRAATPSAAAEIISQKNTKILQKLENLEQSLLSESRHLLASKHQALNSLELRLNKLDPKYKVANQQQKLDEYEWRLKTSILNRVEKHKRDFVFFEHKLSQHDPAIKIETLRQKLSRLDEKLTVNIEQALTAKQNAMALIISKLNAYSPLATLSRGYSISQKPTAEIIKSVSQVDQDEILITKLNDGVIESKVTKVVQHK